MKIKTPTEFLTFNDGTAYIYTVKNNKLDKLVDRYHFGKRTTTYKRYYAARTANTKIDRVIQIPYKKEFGADCAVVIDRVRYRIEQQQITETTNPTAVVLTLSKIGVIPNS
jgi:hypothetical protein